MWAVGILLFGSVVGLWTQKSAAQSASSPESPVAFSHEPAHEPAHARENAREHTPGPNEDAQRPGDAARWADATYPEDPFAATYQLPRAREVGTTAGQFRMIGSGLLNFGGTSPALGLHGTLELMTFAYLGVRGSLQTTLFGPSSEPLVFAAKAGASLHVLPYRRVDLSLFFEGGIGVVDPTKPSSAPMPLVSPGATFEIWLSHWAFLHSEVHLDWGIYERAALAHKYMRVGGKLGLGIAL